MPNATPRKLYLCGGTQCSGSSLISWCFLQRPDMDGVLDARFDMLPQLPKMSPNVLPWCKFTVACFRFSEVLSYFQDEGWEIAPLLVVRDERSVFNSLSKKRIGMNGITAEEPPLRLRLQRLRDDWRIFRDNAWPILRYESFVASPETELQNACSALQIPWDEAMISWPKTREQMADARWGSRVLHESRNQTLRDSLRTDRAAVQTQNILPDDFAWLEREFAEFNRDMNYAAHVDYLAPTNLDSTRLVPCYENTRRYWREARKGPIRKTLRSIARVFENIGDYLHRPPQRPGNVGIPASTKPAGR
jgi:hypothetical protein